PIGVVAFTASPAPRPTSGSVASLASPTLIIRHVALWRAAGLCALRLLSIGQAHRRAWRWNSNRACERAVQYQLGDKIHGFTVNQLFLTAVKLSHDDTGAKYLHLAREDTNNLFRYMVHCKNMVLNVLFKSGMSSLLQRCKEMQ
uniref:Uncharacterized protein n=1 Tax=Piliocolobus tephrosceles TaxID=591936 RepID=A0A8C9HUX6_9PRIM